MSQAKAVSPSKLVATQTYTLQQGERSVVAVFVGTGWQGSTGPVKPLPGVRFASACNGDRWTFVTADGRELLLRKSFDKNYKPCLAPTDSYVAAVPVKFYAV